MNSYLEIAVRGSVRILHRIMIFYYCYLLKNINIDFLILLRYTTLLYTKDLA